MTAAVGRRAAIEAPARSLSSLRRERPDLFLGSVMLCRREDASRLTGLGGNLLRAAMLAEGLAFGVRCPRCGMASALTGCSGCHELSPSRAGPPPEGPEMVAVLARRLAPELEMSLVDLGRLLGFDSMLMLTVHWGRLPPAATVPVLEGRLWAAIRILRGADPGTL